MTSLEALEALEESQPPRRPSALVIVTAHDVQCDVCARPMMAGVEAVRWYGRSLAHVGCADPFAGPRGW